MKLAFHVDVSALKQSPSARRARIEIIICGTYSHESVSPSARRARIEMGVKEKAEKRIRTSPSARRARIEIGIVPFT